MARKRVRIDVERQWTLLRCSTKKRGAPHLPGSPFPFSSSPPPPSSAKHPLAYAPILEAREGAEAEGGGPQRRHFLFLSLRGGGGGGGHRMRGWGGEREPRPASSRSGGGKEGDRGRKEGACGPGRETGHHSFEAAPWLPPPHRASTKGREEGGRRTKGTRAAFHASRGRSPHSRRGGGKGGRLEERRRRKGEEKAGKRRSGVHPSPLPSPPGHALTKAEEGKEEERSGMEKGETARELSRRRRTVEGPPLLFLPPHHARAPVHMAQLGLEVAEVGGPAREAPPRAAPPPEGGPLGEGGGGRSGAANHLGLVLLPSPPRCPSSWPRRRTRASFRTGLDGRARLEGEGRAPSFRRREREALSAALLTPASPHAP